MLVRPHSVDAFAEALRFTDWERFDAGRLRASAERFSDTQFRKRFVAAVAGATQDEKSWNDAKRTRPPAPPNILRPVPALVARSHQGA